MFKSRRNVSTTKKMFRRLGRVWNKQQVFLNTPWKNTFPLSSAFSSCTTSTLKIPVDSSQCQTNRCYGKTASTALALIKDLNLKHIRYAPAPALVLGLGGLVPFVSIPAYMVSSGYFIPALAFSQAAYGACILSFIGGVRWGITLSEDERVKPNWFNIGYSVTPSLVAWTALMLPTPMCMITLMAEVAGSAYMDLTMGGYPQWFKALRFLLSLFAILSLWSTLMCLLILDEKQKNSSQTDNGKPKVESVPVVDN